MDESFRKAKKVNSLSKKPHPTVVIATVNLFTRIHAARNENL